MSLSRPRGGVLLPRRIFQDLTGQMQKLPFTSVSTAQYFFSG